MVSLTNNGLILEPKVYNSASGAHYGTPKFVVSDYDVPSLGGGSWSGLHLNGYGYEIVRDVTALSRSINNSNPSRQLSILFRSV